MNELVHRQRRTRSAAPSRKEPGRTNDPERTKANILEVAEAEFGEKGLAGARIDEIAETTRTSATTPRPPTCNSGVRRTLPKVQAPASRGAVRCCHCGRPQSTAPPPSASGTPELGARYSGALGGHPP